MAKGGNLPEVTGKDFVPNQTSHPKMTDGNHPRSTRGQPGLRTAPELWAYGPLNHGSSFSYPYPVPKARVKGTAYCILTLIQEFLPASDATILAIWLRRWLSSSCSSVVRLRAGRAGFFKARSRSSDPRRLGTEALRCMTIRGLGFQVCLRGRVSLLDQGKTGMSVRDSQPLCPF